jgi:hypothetical protein
MLCLLSAGWVADAAVPQADAVASLPWELSSMTAELGFSWLE